MRIGKLKWLPWGLTLVVAGREVEVGARKEGAIKFEELFKNLLSKAKSSPK